MSEPESANNVIQKTLSQIDKNVKHKIDIQFIFLRWREFVGNFADKISPVDIKGKTLILHSNNSTLKDKFKYRVKTLIQKINSTFGEEVIDKIIFGMNFAAPKNLSVEGKKSIQPVSAEVPSVEVTSNATLGNHGGVKG